jgi:hypothetical protein
MSCLNIPTVKAECPGKKSEFIFDFSNYTTIVDVRMLKKLLWLSTNT